MKIFSIIFYTSLYKVVKNYFSNPVTAIFEIQNTDIIHHGLKIKAVKIIQGITFKLQI